ncbi:MAG: metalloregulator ArsR/SmtB family transcription factor [Xanthomonadales bacterium]|nr:winged helix-turn-helix transcriptional regulator [Xanthomonadales bacterium]NIX11573.1 metalloregulator ArsR/SmtB family transcription factor [Xanthomonadales bacterium]
MSVRSENLFKALADGQRRRILTMLRGSEMAAGEIAEQLGLTPATVSHHLSRLKGADLVRARREGQQRIYTINVSVVEEALMLLAGIIRTDEEKTS